ncbi:MAG: GntP family permease [Bacteroidetes bacterium]|nr:GntP family permease [Bacteroidota bacterium]
MTTSFLQVIIFLLLGIALIILLTTRYKIHAFFALFAACFVVGLGVQLPVNEILTAMKTGFGHIMESLGFIIVLGTALGVLLEHTGCTAVMAEFILKKTGQHRAPLAMNITGFIVGMPIFCDSGYIVLSGLNQSLARRTGINMAIMATSLAGGLYAVHCLIPPHPGAAAAAGILNVDFGKLILAGIGVALPSTTVGYIWAKYAGRKLPASDTRLPEEVIENKVRPGVLQSFLPVIVPILLIAIGAFAKVEQDDNFVWQILNTTGNPIIALCAGVILALTTMRGTNKIMLGKLLQEGAEKAGGILVIIGAGGAFGAVLAATKLGAHLSDAVSLKSMGILFPFLITALLKTAQGSSTVAIITSASIIQPLLPSLGLDSDTGRLLCILSMGAGSMTLSHANDAYFWVISKFSGLEMKTMLRVYSLATLFMGLTAFMVVYALSLFMM